MKKTSTNKQKKQKQKTADLSPIPDVEALKPRLVEVVSLDDIEEEGDDTAVLDAETTLDLLEDAQEERYAKEVAWYTDDEEIEESLAEQQQLSQERPPLQEKLENYHAQSPKLSGGDVDAAWDQANVAGEEAVGGTAPTPDQDSVDEIGEAMGITYEDDEPLHTGEILEQRDKKRWELDIDSTETADSSE